MNTPAFRSRRVPAPARPLAFHAGVLLVAWVGFVLLAGAAPARAQSPTGILDGVVRDPQGRSVADAEVIVGSPALIGGRLGVRSDPRGYFRAVFLPPGRYDVSASVPGFQLLERKGLVVRAGQTTSADLVLALGRGQESVVVSGSSPTIDPRSAKLAFSYDSQLRRDIPTVRDVHGLVATIPGVESANNYGVFQPGSIELQSVLGAGTRANSYALDGANVTDPALQSNQANLLSFDIVEEVHVVAGAKPAELGYQGGYFDVVTRSGGDELTGEVSAFFQTDSLQSSNAGDLLRESGTQTSNRLQDAYDLSASLGGRLVREKLWWFASARRSRATSTLFGFPEDVHDDVNAYFGKATWQPVPSHRFTLMANRWEQTVDYFFLDFSPSLARDPQASTYRPIYGNTFSLHWSGTLSERLFAEARVGTSNQGLDQLFQPGAGVAVLDLVTGERFHNSGSGSRDHDARNWVVSGALSWFVPDAAGRHVFKAGAEYMPTHTSIVFDDLEDHRLNLLNGNPFSVRILNTPAHAVWDVDHVAAWVQDSWTILSRLTLDLGVRYEHSVASTPDQATGGGAFAGTALAERFPALEPTTLPATELIRWNDLAPRLAAVYSLDADGRSVVRASASRYHHFLESFALFASNPAFPLNYGLRWTDANGDRAYQVGEEGALLFRFGGALNTVSPDARRPYTDELIVGFSHQPWADVQLSANLIYRKDQDLLNTIDVGAPPSSYTPVEVVDPGDDGQPGTADDGTLTVYARDPATLGRSSLLLVNPDHDDRVYKALELTASRRFSGRWQAVASLVVSDMQVTKPSNPTSVNGLFDNPNALVNARGRDPLNQRWVLKLQGTWVAPHDVRLSAFWRYASGLPVTRELVVQGLPQGPVTVFAEPRGSRTTESSSVLDVRVEKTLAVTDDLRLGLVVDVFNLTNAGTVIEEGTRTGVDLGEPRAVRSPRIARLGARLSW